MTAVTLGGCARSTTRDLAGRVHRGSRLLARWLSQFGDEPDEQTDYPAFIAEVGALAMGSTTYEWIAAELGFVDDPGTWPYEQPTWVFSGREAAAPDGAGHPVRLGRCRTGARRDGRGGGRQERLAGGRRGTGGAVPRRQAAGRDHRQRGSGDPRGGRAAVATQIVTPPLRLREARAVGEAFSFLRYEVQREA